MSKRLELTGQRFGRFFVKSFAYMRPNGSYWNCRCECGVEKIVRGGDLNKGATLSCGCLGIERRAVANTIHGKSKTPTFEIWCAIIQRCENPKNKNYSRYGGRGITICKRWRSSFQAFLVDMGERPDGMSIDRIDNDGNYEPNNCRWATREGQVNNLSSNIRLTVNGQTHTIAEWERIQGFTKDTIGYRIRVGWSHEKAILTPVKKATRAHG